MMNAQEIIHYIATAEKKTPVKITLREKAGEAPISFGSAKVFGVGDKVIFGDWKELGPILEANRSKIDDMVIENDCRNSAIPLLDLKGINARIEPGAVIRDQVTIGDGAVVMMGAIINIGAVIGEGTMIDMGVVMGGRATVGRRCHIGAGTVLAGVVEPASAQPVIIDDNVFIGANAVVIEGIHVGEGAVVAAGSVADICKVKRSITGAYLSGRKFVEVPEIRREGNGKALRVVKAHENNLQDITVDFPLGKLICVTGVSGSGKSTLVNEILYKTLAAALNGARSRPGQCEEVEGMEWVDKVIGIDQSPIGRTPRSNPATYTGVFGDIRTLFSNTQDAKMRGYGPGRFSFNVKGGRCEACEGGGILTIEMHFLPDIYVPCDVCKGKRYNRETLEVKYKDKTISDVLDMTVEEACVFFANIPKIARKLQTLQEVGLGYIQLGQAATTLSGGEAQRVKLANELARRDTGQTVYILDEPTTGLHVADVHRLVKVLDKLVDAGNTVIVIEHNLDVIKRADYIIDLGPEGGSGGGTIVATGTPEEVAQNPHSFTGQYLRPVLERAAELQSQK